MAKFDETPIIKDPAVKGELRPPKIREHASAEVKCHPSKPKDTAAINLPSELVPDWQERAIARFGELLDKNQALRVYMDACVRCGACTDKCQFFLGTGDPQNFPVARAELMRKVYRRYFTPAGLVPGLGDAADFDEEMLQKWYTYFYQCSECRRCSVFCPYGIDTAEITAAAREIMASIGISTKYVTEVVAKVYETGNNLGIPPLAWIDNSEFLAEDMEEITGLPIQFPVDEEGADILLIPPSADNFANTDTMIGYGKLFHFLGVSWTTSTYCNEAGNFGLFLNFENLQKVNQRMLEAGRQLGAKTIIWGECGHAWRAGILTPTLSGSMDDFDPPYPYHISQYIVDMFRKGAFEGHIDKSANDEFLVTYHDPCNSARAGNLLDEPREIIRNTCNRFVEMPRNTIRENTFCCGAGGGLLTDELMPIRMAGGKPRAEAVKYTQANYLATVCAICKAQLPELMKYWEVPVQVGGVIDLLANSLKLK
ncbi:MAG: (Fe-S)-binding protein [Anaerolineales bacterium]|uniref:(Fe-S)-binding protein n=1 Tax=Candidatus Desulfolinea nitratireducens TaxID=2841698 RepID=A0A8J6TFP7_9CHLR|nr:(Fe-S)-binding protein [Candidatus Desulfolinea nitratireducens]MBL6959680.1 (Fe-S)-binding protein [Anaerolineales bacterium]